MKDLVKKWWFWVIMLAIAIVLGITIIMLIALNLATKGIHEVAREVQLIDSEATVYTSAGGNNIIIDIPNYSDDTKKNKKDEIKALLKEYASKNGILSNYSKAILLERINSSDNNIKDYILSTIVYKLPNMIEDDESKVYIDLIEQTKESFENEFSTTESKSEQKGEDIILTAGKYTVGIDIKAGKYDAIAQANSGNFFVNGSTSVIEILSAENNGFGIPQYSNLNLKDGDEVEIRSNLLVKLQAK